MSTRTRKARQIETRWGLIPTTKKAQREKYRQRSLGEVKTKTHGGVRAGAGRKKKDPTARDNVKHRTRPLHVATNVLHITLRRAKGLPSFRAQSFEKLLRNAIREWGADRNGKCVLDEIGFRIIQYSIQSNHIHLIVEADRHNELSSGLRSFIIRVALRVNRRLLGRKRGRVWGDRYHRHDLSGPSEVRNALVYVLKNHSKHGGEADVGRIDPFSSAPWFKGWIHPLEPPAAPSPVANPYSWLLRTGWNTMGGGWIHSDEKPRDARAVRAHH